MLTEKCAALSLGVGLSCSEDMSALSVRGPSLQATMLDTRSLRVRGVTTIEGVRRNLFGCGTDRDENRRFAERELARQREIDSQRWGFDLANERPLPGVQRFVWQLVPASTVPAALRRAPMNPAVTKPKPTVTTPEVKMSSPESSKTQKRITDFLKPRKRLASNGQKSPSHSHKHECGAHIRPPKVVRLAQAYKRPS